jgi:hypothetical protein
MALDTEADRQAGCAVTRFPHALAFGRPMLWGAGLEEAVDTTLALPAGTVTFLMTDIEGSTRLWEANPEAMAQAVPIHYALLSEAIAQYGGARPDEQGEGDSVLGAFARASDAVRAALEAQLALARQAWPGEIKLTVRIALHTAEAQLRDEGNYFGVALSRAPDCEESPTVGRRSCHARYTTWSSSTCPRASRSSISAPIGSATSGGRSMCSRSRIRGCRRPASGCSRSTSSRTTSPIS